MKNVLLVITLFLSSIIWSQNSSFSNETLQKFAEAYLEVRNQNMTLQLNMITAIENAGLTSDEFNDIHLSLKDTSKKQPTAEERKQYDNALKNIAKLNESIQENIERIIISKGLKVDTYQSIAKASATDSSLKQKIQKLIN
jgi:hypothetical protein